MSSAIVRLKKDRQIVGFYACDDSYGLFNLVDEITSPYDCEYMWVKYGGFHWPKPEAAIIFSDEYLEDDTYEMEPPTFDGVEMDEYLFTSVLNAAQDTWTEFTEDDSYLNSMGE